MGMSIEVGSLCRGNLSAARGIAALIDQPSSGGNLLDSLGRAGGILNTAKGLFS